MQLESMPRNEHFCFLTVFNRADENVYREGVINNIKAFAISPRFNQR